MLLRSTIIILGACACTYGGWKMSIGPAVWTSDGTNLANWSSLKNKSRLAVIDQLSGILETLWCRGAESDPADTRIFESSALPAELPRLQWQSIIYTGKGLSVNEFPE